MCLKAAFVWRPLCSWKSQQEFGRNLSVGRWQIPVQWDVYWFTVLSLAAAFALDIFSCFLKLLQRIIIHFMKLIYFTHPTGHWFTYFSGNIPLLSELCSLLLGCVRWDVRTSWAMVLLHDLLMRGVTFNNSCENTRVTKLFGRWKQPESSCFLLSIVTNVGATIFSQAYELL